MIRVSVLNNRLIDLIKTLSPGCLGFVINMKTSESASAGKSFMVLLDFKSVSKNDIIFSSIR
jgi:hypothetical protein